jgi:hypothetical protein
MPQIPPANINFTDFIDPSQSVPPAAVAQKIESG